MINDNYIDQYESKIKDENLCLNESDFYPPADNRKLKSLIYDLHGETFADYAEYIFDLYEEEDWYEN